MLVNSRILFTSALQICMALVFLSCQAQQACISCGAVTFKTRYYDQGVRKYVAAQTEQDVNMWYKDSFAIMEVHHVYFEENPYGQRTVKVLVDHYKFMNLKTQEIYEYGNFSDTAQLRKKCLPNDSNCKGECWKFFNDKVVIQTKNLILIPDTIMNGVKYKRVKSIDTLQTSKGVLQSVVYGYLRCDKRNAIYNIDAKFSKQFGCPLVRMDYLNIPKLYPDTYYEMEFRSAELTKEELKIFAAWERKARKY